MTSICPHPHVTTSRREDGTFLFDGIQPGDYYLVVTTSGRMEEAAYVNVSIRRSGRVAERSNEHRREGVRPHCRRWPACGRRRFADTFGSLRIRRWGRSAPLCAGAARLGCREPTGSSWPAFEGRWCFPRKLAAGALLSIQRRGEEIAGKTLEFVGTERFDDVVVALTTQVAQVDVTVTSASARGEPEPVLVILFSEDPKRWHHGSSRYARTTALPVSAAPGTLGPARTQLIRVPPGRYLIAAIHDVDLSYPTEVGVLEHLRPLAMPVTLVAGQTAKVTLVVAKAAR